MASREVEIVVVVLARLKTRDQGRFDQLDLLFERRPIRRRLSMSRQSLISGDLHRHASHQGVGLAVVERVSNHAGFVAGIFGADVAEDSLFHAAFPFKFPQVMGYDFSGCWPRHRPALPPSATRSTLGWLLPPPQSMASSTRSIGVRCTQVRMGCQRQSVITWNRKPDFRRSFPDSARTRQAFLFPAGSGRECASLRRPTRMT